MEFSLCWLTRLVVEGEGGRLYEKTRADINESKHFKRTNANTDRPDDTDAYLVQILVNPVCLHESICLNRI